MMNIDFSFTAIPAVTVICYLLASAVKAAGINEKWLPVFCGVLGGALGTAAMLAMPAYPADDPITAAALGVVSGLAATGTHQIFKQLGR